MRREQGVFPRHAAREQTLFPQQHLIVRPVRRQVVPHVAKARRVAAGRCAHYRIEARDERDGEDAARLPRRGVELLLGLLDRLDVARRERTRNERPPGGGEFAVFDLGDPVGDAPLLIV